MRRMGRKQMIIELQKPVAELPPSLSRYGLEIAGDGRALVYFYDTQGERTGITTLLNDLQKENIVLRDVRTRESSLEDIFVDLVGGAR
jgi:ABC-2 type transport system ATP-binding protein